MEGSKNYQKIYDIKKSEKLLDKYKLKDDKLKTKLDKEVKDELDKVDGNNVRSGSKS